MNLIQFVSYAKKFFVAVVAALGVLAVAMSDDVVTRSEWVQIAIAAAGAIGVYATPNVPKKKLK